MAKSKEMRELREKAAQLLFGRSHDAQQSANLCTTCGGDADKFTDDLSEKEYSLSGMCQACQDGFFEDEDGDIHNADKYYNDYCS
jgi:hypothetical protein